MLISPSWDMASKDFVEAWLVVEGTNAAEGDTRASAAHAVDRREEAVMVVGWWRQLAIVMRCSLALVKML